MAVMQVPKIVCRTHGFGVIRGSGNGHIYSKNFIRIIFVEQNQSVWTPRTIKSPSSSAPADMNGPTAQFVKDSISQDTVVIFSKTYCPYCKMAKDVFNKVQASFTAIELDNRDDGNEIQSILGEMTGARTVPRVFIKGQCVGGGNDVKDLYERGKLEQMLD